KTMKDADRLRHRVARRLARPIDAIRPADELEHAEHRRDAALPIAELRGAFGKQPEDAKLVGLRSRETLGRRGGFRPAPLTPERACEHLSRIDVVRPGL